MAYTARTPEQYFVFQHLEDLEDRDCASVHDIACDVFTGTDGDQERVSSVLYLLKSWRLVEETVAGFRLREGAVLLPPARLPRQASKPPAPAKPAAAPAGRPAPSPPSCPRPSPRPSPRRASRPRKLRRRRMRRARSRTSVSARVPRGRRSALVRRSRGAAGASSSRRACQACCGPLRWARPPTVQVLFVGDVVEPVEDRGIRCEITKVGRKYHYVDFGDGSRLETFEANQLRLIKGITNVYRDAPTLSRQRRDALIKLAQDEYKPMVYEKGDDGTYKAEELPFAMNGPEAARRTPSTSYDLNGQ